MSEEIIIRRKDRAKWVKLLEECFGPLDSNNRCKFSSRLFRILIGCDHTASICNLDDKRKNIRIIINTNIDLIEDLETNVQEYYRKNLNLRYKK